MTSHQIIQHVGSAGVGLLGVLLIWTALSNKRYTSYGREALACAGTYLLCVVVIRTLSALKAITLDERISINGLLSFVFVAILAQIIVLAWYENRVPPSDLERRL